MPEAQPGETQGMTEDETPPETREAKPADRTPPPPGPYTDRNATVNTGVIEKLQPRRGNPALDRGGREGPAGHLVGQRVEEIQPRTPTAHHQHILCGLWHQDGGPNHREVQGPSPQQCRIQGGCHIVRDVRSGGVLVREGGCQGSGHPKPQPRWKNPGTGDQLWIQTSSTNRGQDAA